MTGCSHYYLLSNTIESLQLSVQVVFFNTCQILSLFSKYTHTHTHTQTTGIIVLVMLFSSCLCCCSIFSLCCGNFPKAVKIAGAIALIIMCLALSIYIGWVAVGTYFAIQIRSADAVCRNTIVYLVLLYIYLVVLVLVGLVVVIWKCHDVSTRSQAVSTDSEPKMRHR